MNGYDIKIDLEFIWKGKTLYIKMSSYSWFYKTLKKALKEIERLKKREGFYCVATIEI